MGAVEGTSPAVGMNAYVQLRGGWIGRGRRLLVEEAAATWAAGEKEATPHVCKRAG